MTRALNQIPGVVAFGETLFWGRFYEQPDEEGFYQKPHLERLAKRYEGIQIGPNGGIGGLRFPQEFGGKLFVKTIMSAVPPITPRNLFELLGRAVVEASGENPNTTAWVEKTPHHLMHIDRIVKADPTARMIVMLREPQRFLLSYKHIGDLKPTHSQKQFHNLYHPLTAAIVCRGYLKAALDAAERYPKQVQICRFEEITTNFPRAMAEVCHHLNLPLPRTQSYPSDNTSFLNADVVKRPELSRHDKAWLNLICRDAAIAAGYSIPEQPLLMSVGYATISSGKLLPWLFRNGKLLRQTSSGGVISVLKRWLK